VVAAITIFGHFDVANHFTTINLLAASQGRSCEKRFAIRPFVVARRRIENER
jgi:hypothetical protein